MRRSVVSRLAVTAVRCAAPVQVRSVAVASSPRIGASAAPVARRMASAAAPAAEVPSTAAAGANGAPVTIPFNVQRTSTNNLPVYTEYRNGGTRKLTIVRLIEGDIPALCKELERVTGSTVSEFVGRVEVKGVHSKLIKDYLRDLGF